MWRLHQLSDALRRKQKCFFGGGSPYGGTSHIRVWDQEVIVTTNDLVASYCCCLHT
jgi:hypothetical protein